MKSLLLLLLLAIALFAGWDMYLAEHKLPHPTKLTAKDGKTADVVILSSTATQVRFRLLQNPMVYEWPLDDLNLISRYKALRLVHSSKKVLEEEHKNSPKTIERQRGQQRTSTYVQNLEEQIAANNMRIEVLQSRLAEERSRRAGSTTMTMSAEERSLTTQIQKLSNEIDTYNRRIAEEIRNHR